MTININSGMSTALQVIEALGIIAFASSGFIEARRKEMDLIGVFTVAFITAFGGGTLRDILLDRRPLFWVQHQEYTLLIFVLALVVLPLSHYIRSSSAERAIIFADALGLGLFEIGQELLKSRMQSFAFMAASITRACLAFVLCLAAASLGGLSPRR